MTFGNDPRKVILNALNNGSYSLIECLEDRETKGSKWAIRVIFLLKMKKQSTRKDKKRRPAKKGKQPQPLPDHKLL